MQTTTLDVSHVCDTCGEVANEVQTHHIRPRSRGGRDIPSNLVRVCLDCHAAIHVRDVTAAALIAEGIAFARASGAKWGRPSATDAPLEQRIKALRADGLSIRSISQQVGLSVGTVHKVCKAS